jgi:hypothetical protein
MSWPVDAEVTTRDKEGKVVPIPSMCQVGLVDGVWSMTVTFDKDVTFKSMEKLNIICKLDKP